MWFAIEAVAELGEGGVIGGWLGGFVGRCAALKREVGACGFVGGRVMFGGAVFARFP